MLVVLLPACQASPDDYPPRPGGGGPVIIGGGGGGSGGGGGGDAGVGDGGGGAGVQIFGRACVLADLRMLTKCRDTGAGGLKVSLGTGTGTTNPDGTFTMVAPLGAGFTWHVTGASFVTSVMPFGTDNTIPVMTSEEYLNLLELNASSLQDEQHGSVVVRVVAGSSPVAGVTASLSPVADSPTYYDAMNSPTDWNTTSTGPAGVVWVPSVSTRSLVTLTLSTAGKTTLATALAESQAITFVTQSVP